MTGLGDLETNALNSNGTTEMPSVKDCKYCIGTGKTIARNSWFNSDGFRYLRCGVCGGTGKSNYVPAAEVISQDRRLRKIFGVMPDE